MAIRDYFEKLVSYFDTEDLIEEEVVETAPPRQAEVKSVTALPKKTPQAPTKPVTRKQNNTMDYQNNTTQATTSINAQAINSVIDVKFPKKYEEAREIIDHLVQGASVLIDFQNMTDSQARRCIDYLDGARYVISGNLKKISATMWLLTPADVVVNFENINLDNSSQDNDFDFDMRKR